MHVYHRVIVRGYTDRQSDSRLPLAVCAPPACPCDTKVAIVGSAAYWPSEECGARRSSLREDGRAQRSSQREVLTAKVLEMKLRVVPLLHSRTRTTHSLCSRHRCVRAQGHPDETGRGGEPRAAPQAEVQEVLTKRSSLR